MWQLRPGFDPATCRLVAECLIRPLWQFSIPNIHSCAVRISAIKLVLSSRLLNYYLRARTKLCFIIGNYECKSSTIKIKLKHSLHSVQVRRCSPFVSNTRSHSSPFGKTTAHESRQFDKQGSFECILGKTRALISYAI